MATASRLRFRNWTKGRLTCEGSDFSLVRQWIRQADWVGPDELGYAARNSVWIRWLILASAAVDSAYRPPDAFAAFVALVLVLGALNAGLHYKLIRKRPFAPNLLLGIGVMDVVVITAAVGVHGGFESFIYLAYFPAVCGFALLAGAPGLVLAWSTLVAVTYAAVCLMVGSGVDIDARDEKELFWRIAMLYGVVAAVTMITRLQRIQRREAVERERALQRERIDLSQAIHDTTAQTAYMIGLGIDSAIDLAGESNPELSETLAATSTLSKSAMWDLRRPIDMGHIFEGQGARPRAAVPYRDVHDDHVAVPRTCGSWARSQRSARRSARGSSRSHITRSRTHFGMPARAGSKSCWASRPTR